MALEFISLFPSMFSQNPVMKTHNVKNMSASFINSRPEHVWCCIVCPRKLLNPSSMSSHMWPIFQCPISSQRHLHSVWIPWTYCSRTIGLKPKIQWRSFRYFAPSDQYWFMPSVWWRSSGWNEDRVLSQLHLCQSVFFQQRQQEPVCCLWCRMSVPIASKYMVIVQPLPFQRRVPLYSFLN